tara:strand:- start:37 stop:474 length:438 start_codon:yes stop_codon:yes gene_type:complete
MQPAQAQLLLCSSRSGKLSPSTIQLSPIFPQLTSPNTANLISPNRKDMKTAMQQKDSNRLAVLRALLSQTLNASKTSSPINTDMQMLSLLRKSANAAKAAAEEFKGAGRQDLADKEDLQRAVWRSMLGVWRLWGRGRLGDLSRGW